MQKMIIVCGWAISGKGAIATRIAETLKIQWIDIDDIRFLNFGPPNPHPNVSEEMMTRDRAEMKGSYELLCSAVKIYLSIKRSLIVTATFSRSAYWNEIIETLEKYPGADLKIIWCKPLDDTDEEIWRRLEGRVFGVNCWSSVNSLERYNEVKNRYQPPKLPYLELDTSSPKTIDECVKRAIKYIQAE